MNRKGGVSCIFRGCQTRSSEGVALFRIPADQARARCWLEAAHRKDLCAKSNEKLHRSFRLCALHFENKWFTKTGDCRKRLLAQAVPTLFGHDLEKDATDANKERTISISDSKTSRE